MRSILMFVFIFNAIFVNILFAEQHKHDDDHSEHGEETESVFTLEDSELLTLGLTLKKPAPAQIVDGMKASGKIIPISSKFVHVAPRFGGVIKEVKARVGDTIEAGIPLAIIQNNQNLQTFTVTSAKKGVVIERHATLGESVAETATLFVVADLSEVLAELAIDRKEVAKVKVGQKVRVTVPSSSVTEEGEISFVAPVTDEVTQSTFVRVNLKNINNQFPPGVFVKAMIVTSEAEVPLAIESKAIESVKGVKTVFIRKGHSFEPHPIKIGHTDEVMSEILSGVENSEQYASGNTDLLKVFLDDNKEHSHEEEAEHEDSHSEEHEHREEEEHAEEGHLKLSPESISNANIAIETAGSAKLQVKLFLNGEISPNADKVAHVTPRFPGIIRETRKNLGDTVAQGEVLAVIESNQSVQPYQITAPINGIIIERHSTEGEFNSGDSPIFVIADLSEVWIDLIVPEESAVRIKPGQIIIIPPILDSQKPLQGVVAFLSPVVDETTQSRFARAIIANKDGHLLPGAFASGEVIVDDSEVRLAVKDEGTQNIDGKTVLFVEEKEGAFEKRDIILGREDGVFSEVLKGLAVGERYIATNSFLLKAELGKSEAEHEH